LNYENKYNLLLQSEVDWSQYTDRATKKKVDLSIKLHDYEGTDLEVMDAMNQSMANTQVRRTVISGEKIKAIRNSSKWKKLYYAVKSLQEEMENFWLRTDEIKKQRSADIRNAEIFKRIKPVIDLRNKIEVYFKEGKHRDMGESLSYEYACQEALNNLDASRDTLKAKKFGVFKERD
jgi:hypothetical protein